MNELWQPIGVVVAAAVTAVVGYLGIRYVQRSARAASDRSSGATWERKYRSNAEKHMGWDFQAMDRVNRQGRILADLLPIDHPERAVLLTPLPDPPPLFPAPVEGGEQ